MGSFPQARAAAESAVGRQPWRRSLGLMQYGGQQLAAAAAQRKVAEESEVVGQQQQQQGQQQQQQQEEGQGYGFGKRRCPRLSDAARARFLRAARAGPPGRCSALSASHSKSVLHGAFVWARRLCNSQTTAVSGPGRPPRLCPRPPSPPSTSLSGSLTTARRGFDRASPKKSSPKTALKRKTLCRKAQEYSFLTPDWSAPSRWGPIVSAAVGPGVRPHRGSKTPGIQN
jgi:hypothetical protein